MAQGLNQQIFTWLYIYPWDVNASWKSKLSSAAFTGFILACMIFTVVSSAHYIYKHISVDFEGVLYATFQFAGSIGSIYMTITAYIMRHQIVQVFNKFQYIHAAHANTRFGRLLEEVAKQNDRKTQLCINYMVQTFVFGNFFIVLTNIAICVKHGSIKVQHLFFPAKFFLPWNQQELPGWIGLVFCTVLIVTSYFVLNGAFMSFFISICNHYSAFYMRFQELVENVDTAIRSQRQQPTEKNHIESALSELVRFHMLVKEVFSQTSNIFKYFILSHIICNVIFLACASFELNKAMEHIDFNIFIILIAMIYSLLNLYLYCEYGDRSTEYIQKMSDCLFESKWYESPIELRKFYVIMLMNAQRPQYYNGFGVINLNLETFSKILNSVFSFYMMFNTLAQK